MAKFRSIRCPNNAVAMRFEPLALSVIPDEGLQINMILARGPNETKHC
jgi:hypothetical protein